MKTQTRNDIWWNERPQRTNVRSHASLRPCTDIGFAGRQVWAVTFLIGALIPVVSLCLKIAAGSGA